MTITDNNPFADPALLTTADHERLQFVACQAIGHAWFYSDGTWESRIGTPVTLRCERCGTERHDSMDRYGRVNARSYVHPDGYKYPKGTRPTKDEFRVLALAQLIQDQRKQRRRK